MHADHPVLRQLSMLIKLPSASDGKTDRPLGPSALGLFIETSLKLDPPDVDTECHVTERRHAVSETLL